MPLRRRYTIAHEIAHWVLHRDRGVVHCRHVAPSPLRVHYSLAASNDAIEAQANLFGGVLLMPPALLKTVWDECGGNPKVIADRFQLSPSAVWGGRPSRAQRHLHWDSRAMRHYVFESTQRHG